MDIWTVSIFLAIMNNAALNTGACVDTGFQLSSI